MLFLLAICCASSKIDDLKAEVVALRNEVNELKQLLATRSVEITNDEVVDEVDEADDVDESEDFEDAVLLFKPSCVRSPCQLVPCGSGYCIQCPFSNTKQPRPYYIASPYYQDVYPFHFLKSTPNRVVANHEYACVAVPVRRSRFGCIRRP